MCMFVCVCGCVGVCGCEGEMNRMRGQANNQIFRFILIMPSILVLNEYLT